MSLINHTTSRTPQESPRICGTLSCQVCYGIMVPALAGPGFVGNILSILVLVGPEFRKTSIGILLAFLSTVDIIILTFSLLIFSTLFSCSSLGYLCKGLMKWLPFMYPVSETFHVLSIYITVLIAIDRYIVVRFPLRAHIFCSVRRTMLTMSLTGICCLAYCMPIFFETKYSSKCKCAQPTALRVNYAYRKYYRTLGSFFFSFSIPFLSIAILNVLIIYTMRVRSNSIITRTRQAGINAVQWLTSSAIVILTSTLICNSIPLILNLLEVISTPIGSSTFRDLVYSGNVLVVVKATINPIVYCLLGQKFRREVIRILRCKTTKSQSDVQKGLYEMLSSIIPLTFFRRENGTMTMAKGITTLNDFPAISAAAECRTDYGALLNNDDVVESFV